MLELNRCTLCQPCPHPILWQDDFCRVMLLEDTNYPAYCRVELLAHVKEMTDLEPIQRLRLMHIVFVVERVLRDTFNPTKINLASLGNKTPHLHWHVIPRFEHDQHFPNPHWGEALRENHPAQLNKQEIATLAQTISAAVSQP